jgi:hypothetical protein
MCSTVLKSSRKACLVDLVEYITAPCTVRRNSQECLHLLQERNYNTKIYQSNTSKGIKDTMHAKRRVLSANLAQPLTDVLILFPNTITITPIHTYSHPARSSPPYLLHSFRPTRPIQLDRSLRCCQLRIRRLRTEFSNFMYYVILCFHSVFLSMWTAVMCHVRLTIEFCPPLLTAPTHAEPREKDDEREACDAAYNAAGYSSNRYR